MNQNANLTTILLDKHLPERAEKTAYVCGARRLSYGELAANVNRCANWLQALGVEPGERVAIALRDGFACVYAVLGCIRRGAIPVLVNILLKRAQCQELMELSSARRLLSEPVLEAAQACTVDGDPAVMFDDARAEGLLAAYSPEREAHPASPDDVAMIFYTSGTTGHPKGVPYRHGQFPYVVEAFASDMLRMSEHDVVFSAPKIFFGYGFGNSVLYTLYFGATAVLEPSMMTAPLALEIISRTRPSIFFAVPTLYNALLQAMDPDATFPSLRCCVTAGEPLPGAILRAWLNKTGVEMINGYGATETLHIVTSCRLDPAFPEITGSMLRHFECKVVDEAGNELEDGEPGILLMRGPALAQEYWNDPEWTGKSMLADGWWKSGDLFVKDGTELAYLGRNDDMFKVGGMWVSPVQVESALLSHPDVQACAVTARNTGGLTQARAHVVLTPGTSSELETVGQLRSHVLEQLPKYMCPSEIVFCTALPLTATGKIQRYKLRAEATAAPLTAS